jgi:1-acyl-sn-glycerol-3-phosphate acyltransferase
VGIGVGRGRLGDFRGMPNWGRIWRVVATGFCFFVFTGGAFCLSCFLLPLLRLFFRDPSKLARRTRLFVRLFFRFMTWLIMSTGCMRLRINGAEKLRRARGVLVFANHPTLIDVVVLMGLIPEANCVVKSSLFRSFAMGPTLRSAGYLENAESDRLVEGCCRSMEAGQPLVIFPEGTRTTPGSPMVFQRGPAHLMLASRRPFLPVVIRCRPAALLKGQPWYHVPERRFDLELDVLAEVPPEEWAPLVADLPRPLAVRKLTRQLELFFMSRGDV